MTEALERMVGESLIIRPSRAERKALSNKVLLAILSEIKAVQNGTLSMEDVFSGTVEAVEKDTVFNALKEHLDDFVYAAKEYYKDSIQPKLHTAVEAAKQYVLNPLVYTAMVLALPAYALGHTIAKNKKLSNAAVAMLLIGFLGSSIVVGTSKKAIAEQVETGEHLKSGTENLLEKYYPLDDRNLLEMYQPYNVHIDEKGRFVNWPWAEYKDNGHFLSGLFRGLTNASVVEGYISIMLDEIREKGVIKELSNIYSNKNNTIEKRLGALILTDLLYDQRSIPSLKSILKDESVYIRRAAALILGKMRDGSVTDSLVEVLDDKNRYVRLEAASSLARYKDERALKTLNDLLKDNELRYEERRAIALMIKYVNDTRSKETMITALRNIDLAKAGRQEIENNCDIPTYVVCNDIDREGMVALTNLLTESGYPPLVSEGLSEVKDKKAIPALMDALGKDEFLQWAVTPPLIGMGKAARNELKKAIVEEKDQRVKALYESACIGIETTIAEVYCKLKEYNKAINQLEETIREYKIDRKEQLDGLPPKERIARYMAYHNAKKLLEKAKVEENNQIISDNITQDKH